MKDNYNNYQIYEKEPEEENPNALTRKEIFKHSLLFVITFICVAIMGTQFVGKTADISTTSDVVTIIIRDGGLFAVLLLGFLGTHEFGHYFAAVYHKIRVSLPYFIPLPIISPIGTMGAVIKIKERIDQTKKLFDVGIAGPLAGFVVSLIILLYGFLTLPGPEYLLQFDGHDGLHEYIMEHGTFPSEPIVEEGGGLLMIGNTLLYNFLASQFENAPPLWEMYHYPFLFAGWLGLFFTALNLTPVGQLDGGHILYSLIGYRNHRSVARIFYTAVIMLCGVGIVPILHQFLGDYDSNFGTVAWSIWAFASYMMLRKAFYGNPIWTTVSWIVSMLGSAFLLYFIIDIDKSSGYFIWFFWSLFILYFVKIEHPPVIIEQELSPRRKILGWLSMIIFILCISPNPLYII